MRVDYDLTAVVVVCTYIRRLQRRRKLPVSAATGETQADTMDRARFLRRTAAASVAAITGGLAASSGLQPALAAEVTGTSHKETKSTTA